MRNCVCKSCGTKLKVESHNKDKQEEAIQDGIKVSAWKQLLLGNFIIMIRSNRFGKDLFFSVFYSVALIAGLEI